MPASFRRILERAEKRKGGRQALRKLLPAKPARTALAAMADDRILAEMARRVFCAGFSWSVIDNKWPGFEAAFLSFSPRTLAMQPDEYWDRLLNDARIVRNGIKIMSVRKNAGFVMSVAEEHGSFGRFLAAWPQADQVGLMDLLAKRGGHLGGNTGQMLLRFIGFDGFVLSKDVVACLQDAGVDVADEPKSKRDLQKVQHAFNTWHVETGLPYVQLSRICALSIGVNLPGNADA